MSHLITFRIADHSHLQSLSGAVPAHPRRANKEPRMRPSQPESSPKRRVAMPWKGEAGTPLAPGSNEAPPRACGRLWDRCSAAFSSVQSPEVSSNFLPSLHQFQPLRRSSSSTSSGGGMGSGMKFLRSTYRCLARTGPPSCTGKSMQERSTLSSLKVAFWGFTSSLKRMSKMSLSGWVLVSPRSARSRCSTTKSGTAARSPSSTTQRAGSQWQFLRRWSL
mmetsp:Transcript_41979/g.66554  ORF Transcript_41979/g.66554 Transcript_41979/m.66554 type:complete len:220 (+) Transcript_41979:214-873(+)